MPRPNRASPEAELALAGQLHRITAPPREACHLERPDLVRRATPDPGTFVSIVAPLGFGKTTLAAEVARSGSNPVAWLSLSRSDADPRRLWTGLLATLLPASRPAINAAPLPAAGSPNELWWEAAAALVEALREADPVLVVIDSLDPGVHAAARPGLDYVIEWLPPQHALLTTGRRVPAMAGPGGLPPQCLRRIGSADLRFDDQHSAALARLLATDQSEAVRGTLRSWADGWPAAIRLAAREACNGTSDWIVPVEDTLLDHVCSDSPSLAETILELGTLGWVSASDAAAVGIEVGPFRAAIDTGLLLSLGGDARRWRLPKPLASAADRRLRDTSPSRHQDLHAQAGHMALEAHDTESAIGHLLAAGDDAGARTALHRIEDDLFLTGRATEVRRWYRRVYAGSAEADIERMLRSAWSAALSYDYREAERIVATLRESTVAPNWNSARVAGEVLLLRATLAGRRGHLEDMETLGRRAILAFGDDWSSNSRVLARVVVARAALWREDLPALRMAHDELSRQPDLPEYFTNGLLVALSAGLALAEGRLRDAMRLGHDSRQWLVEHSAMATQAPTRDAELALAAALSEAGLEPDADETLAQLAQFGDERDQTILSILARLHAGRAALLAHRHRDAFSALAAARGIALEVGSSPRLLNRIDELEVPLSLHAGDVARARTALTRLPAGNPRTLLAIAVQQHRRLGSGVRALEGFAAEGPRQQVQQTLLLAQAQMKTNRGAAAHHLSRAAALAEQNGLVLALRLFGSDLIEFAYEVAVREADRALADLVRFSAPEKPAIARAVSATHRSLTPGERQLLALLPTHLRYDGIAASLGVSVNTVKSRLKRLYAKLDASSRTQAVSNARTRGLID